ncbi:thioredoxin domain-containing protein [Kineosporia sp. J2-2]|uniref:Thioredoxin domain-containing protein n=1 Tax=Kineosporia corallincola TaxID=2835133 RepID=A0ABS5TJI4_9ACTN|nr:thioredoxin domain-containing protein [Kineosporia corallincola]MBT0769734.1 thioredoxin domain-containing protein [Kineosporia corallincola]
MSQDVSRDVDPTNPAGPDEGTPALAPFNAVAVRDTDTSRIGLPDNDSATARHVFGNPEAEVCIVEFGDYECPYCAGAAPVLHEVVEASDGRVRLVFQNFPLFETHAFALTAALAAESAEATGGPEVFWKMHHKLFKNQSRLTDADLRLYAGYVGADPERATGEAAQEFAPLVQADYAAGVASGVSGTPTLFIDGAAYQGVVDVPSLRRATSGRRSDGTAGATGMAGTTGGSAGGLRRFFGRG